jgi:hypothetical protein
VHFAAANCPQSPATTVKDGQSAAKQAAGKGYGGINTVSNAAADRSGNVAGSFAKRCVTR